MKKTRAKRKQLNHKCPILQEHYRSHRVRCYVIRILNKSVFSHDHNLNGVTKSEETS